MQTERVTFLTSADHKAALDAFATSAGKSVGHVLREAASRYIAEASAPTEDDEYEQALELALPELEATLAHMNGRLDHMKKTIAAACYAIDRVLEGDQPADATKAAAA